MRIAVLHNLLAGGAHRRLREQLSRLDADVVEVCLQTAIPIRADATVVPLAPRAPRVPRPLRVPLRYVDFLTLLTAWRRAATLVRALDVRVVYANPCRYLQAPAALLYELPPSLYFCDEPRRVDHDPSATGSRSLRTMPVYRPLYAAQRRVDRSAVSRATRLATNSAFSAREIELAYGRQAQVIASGVPELCLRARPRPPTHLLTVGTMIPSKGHDLAIAGASCARTRRRVLLISPRRSSGSAVG